jgi:prolyl oligopeptidase
VVVNLRRVGDSLFYLKADKGNDLRKLVMRAKDGTERVLVDPGAIPDAQGLHASIDHYKPSRDGRFVAYGLARGGDEITTEHVLDTTTGRELADRVERIWGEFTVSWLPDGTGFFYTQMASQGFTDAAVDKFLNMRLFLHRLGEPVGKDVAVLGVGVNATAPFAPQEFPSLVVVPGSDWVLAVAGGARNEMRLGIARLADVLRGKVTWRAICDYDDGISGVVLRGNDVFVLSTKGAPNRRVLRMTAGSPRLDTATVIIPEGDDVIEDIDGASDALYVTVQKGGHALLRRVPYGGGKIEDVPLPFEGWTDQVAVDQSRPGVILHTEAWTHDDTYLRYDPAARTMEKLALKSASAADFGQIDVEEVVVPATDGVEVPLTILHRKGLALDGARPTILAGYGAYGFSYSPSYSPALLAWLERGGVWAVAHVRGGGEKGDAWRTAGSRAKKPSSWRDFNACAEWLVHHHYTSSATLGATGASAGGILVGRAITERPDLFAAASIYAGMVNATRYLESSNGANQMAEMGTPDTAEGFRSLLAMDAYQAVKAGTPYPALMLETGLNDGRVTPWHSAKFGARMQASTSSGRPVLIRVDGDEGHGVGSKRAQRLALSADVWSFFLHEMSDPEFAPAGPTPSR